MLLQERIEELSSAIINIRDNDIFLTGFMSTDGLLRYYEDGLKCHFSTGIYPKENFDIAYIKNKGLFLILEKDKEVCRYEFAFVDKFKIKYKDSADNKRKDKTFEIRKCRYTKKYNFKDSDESLLFDSYSSLKSFLQLRYSYDLKYSFLVDIDENLCC